MTQDELKQLLHYDPSTGFFRWLVSTSNRSPKGSIAGGISIQSGYVTIGVLGKRYQAHRLAVLYMKGYLPKEDVDHVDHIRSNNAWVNLREATRSENNYNRSVEKERPSNTGVKGISFNSRWGRYDCGIKSATSRYRKSFSIRDYTSQEDALLAAIAWVQAVRDFAHKEFAQH